MGFSSSIWCQLTEEEYWGLWNLSAQVRWVAEQRLVITSLLSSLVVELAQDSPQSRSLSCGASLSAYASSLNPFPLQFRGKQAFTGIIVLSQLIL